MHPLIEKNIDKIQQLGQKHHLKSLFVFGSVTTGNISDDSDVDFLYEMDYRGFNFDNLDTMPFDPNKEFFDLKNELKTLLQRKVDLIANKNFRNKYFQEAVDKTKSLIFSNEGFKEVSA